jgi:ribosomal protein S18 acetylase RimI-like enzyme
MNAEDFAVPYVSLTAPTREESGSGMPLRFALSSHFEIEDDGDLASAVLYAFADLEPVGYLVWSSGRNESGEITRLWTAPEVRRRGVATLLWRVAQVVAKERAWTPPEHSDTRTSEGDAWAQRLGAHPAAVIQPWATWD